MFLNLLKIAAGLCLIVGGGVLEVMWLGFLFGSVVGVVLVLIFAPHLLVMPWTIGFAAGMAVLSGVDEKPFEGAEEIAESVGSAAKKTGALVVRFLAILSCFVIAAFVLSLVLPHVKKLDIGSAWKQPKQTYRPAKPQATPERPLGPPSQTYRPVTPPAEAAASGIYVISERKANLFNKPESDGFVLAELDRFDVVEVYQFDDEWAEVSFKGRDGWVLRKHIAPGN